jgi:glycosyltransferase involved in cell wall biosynthesis
VLVQHPRNRGVAAAILTGIRRADTEVVCSIDCDCTYDPHQLTTLIPLLVPGVDMVTASPYHRDGEVRNVPGWRLFLSRSLSFLYRVVLHHRLATYTSCFRVYRRSSISGLQVREGGFLGVAEMLGRLDLVGGQIVECPAVLEVRLLGRSKMRTLRTIVGHLRLLLRLIFARWRGTSMRAAPAVFVPGTGDAGSGASDEDDAPLSQGGT